MGISYPTKSLIEALEHLHTARVIFDNWNMNVFGYRDVELQKSVSKLCYSEGELNKWVTDFLAFLKKEHGIPQNRV